MKFWKKIFLYSLILFLLLFNGGGIILIEKIHSENLMPSHNQGYIFQIFRLLLQTQRETIFPDYPIESLVSILLEFCHARHILHRRDALFLCLHIPECKPTNTLDHRKSSDVWKTFLSSLYLPFSTAAWKAS